MPQPQQGNQDILGAAVERANALREAKAALYKQIAANRRFLRDVKDQGLLNAEQAKWVDDFYPAKQVSKADDSA